MTFPTSPSPVPPGFADQVDAAAALLFPADSPTAVRIAQHTTSLRDDCARLRERGMGDVPTIALVGKVGEGKSWLAQCFLLDDITSSHVREMVRSGQNASDRTHELTWLGESAPFSARSHDELFVRVPSTSMLDLGTPYALADSPGYSDHDPSLGALSSVAITSASVKILSTSVSQIRDGSLLPFVRSMNGASILPVIRFRPASDGAPPTDDVMVDCQKEIAQWAEAAPDCHFAPAVFVPDAGVAGQSDAEAVARRELTNALTPLLADRAALDDHIDVQLRERMTLARQDMAKSLDAFRQRIGDPVDQLHRLTTEASTRIEDELIGNNDVLRGALRARFRGDALDRTPMLLFPYRSLLGVLGLTLGAWDRVIFATMGSVPSLVLSAWQAAKSMKDGQSPANQIRDGLLAKVQESLHDQFSDTLRAFSTALESSTTNRSTTTHPTKHSITLRGLPGLEMKSRTLIADEVRAHRASGAVLWLGGLAATAGFWLLMAGPIAGLYTDYVGALASDLNTGTFDWTSYPTPSASLWVTSLLLSIVPAVAMAMLVMAAACGAGRVHRAANAIRESLTREIHDRFSSGKLKVEINDPKLEAARYLLSVIG